MNCPYCPLLAPSVMRARRGARRGSRGLPPVGGDGGGTGGGGSAGSVALPPPPPLSQVELLTGEGTPQDC